jgi:hypothetical protein
MGAPLGATQVIDSMIAGTIHSFSDRRNFKICGE